MVGRIVVRERRSELDARMVVRDLRALPRRLAVGVIRATGIAPAHMTVRLLRLRHTDRLERIGLVGAELQRLLLAGVAGDGDLHVAAGEERLVGFSGTGYVRAACLATLDVH